LQQAALQVLLCNIISSCMSSVLQLWLLLLLRLLLLLLPHCEAAAVVQPCCG
jgi:hypothetical protein